MERARTWAEAEAKEKAEIARVAAKARYKAEAEATESAKAWADSKSKKKAEIYRIASKASEKEEAEAEVRVTEKACAAKRAVE